MARISQQEQQFRQCCSSPSIIVIFIYLLIAPPPKKMFSVPMRNPDNNFERVAKILEQQAVV